MEIPRVETGEQGAVAMEVEGEVDGEAAGVASAGVEEDGAAEEEDSVAEEAMEADSLEVAGEAPVEMAVLPRPLPS